MAVPPLHKGVLHARVHRVALQRAGRHLQAVENVQDRNRHHGRDVEPQGHVHVPLAAANQRAEKVDREYHPDHRDRQVDRPFEFGVLLAGREAQRQRHRCGDDDQLPAPEVKPAQAVIEQPRFAQPLGRVINGGEHRIAGERKNRRVGVQRPQPAKRRQCQAQIQLGRRQLQRHHQPHQKSDHAPQDRHHQERANNGVVIDEFLQDSGVFFVTARASGVVHVGVSGGCHRQISFTFRSSDMNAPRKPQSLDSQAWRVAKRSSAPVFGEVLVILEQSRLAVKDRKLRFWTQEARLSRTNSSARRLWIGRGWLTSRCGPYRRFSPTVRGLRMAHCRLTRSQRRRRVRRMAVAVGSGLNEPMVTVRE